MQYFFLTNRLENMKRKPFFPYTLFYTHQCHCTEEIERNGANHASFALYGRFRTLCVSGGGGGGGGEEEKVKEEGLGGCQALLFQISASLL